MTCKTATGWSVLASLLLALLLPLPAVGQSSLVQDFWLLDEFMAAHPGEAASAQAFADRVTNPAQAVTWKRDEPLEIVVVYPGLQASDYWRRSVSSFRARMSELGIPFNLVDHFTRPGTDLRLQSRLIGDAMESAPDYLVFTLDALRHRGMIERVMAKGETKIILQNITTPLRAFDQRQPFLYVGFDHGVGARLLAERYKQMKPQGGRYAIFYGPRGYVSRMRGGIFQQVMSEHPNTELVASYYVGFDRERARRGAIELLHNEKDLDFIYACSTDIAIGIVDALKETGRLGSLLVNGWGGGAIELAAIEDGELDFTVMRMNDDNGVAMAEAIRLDVEGAAAEVPTVYSGEFRLVDRTTSKETLAAYRKHAFRYSK